MTAKRRAFVVLFEVLEKHSFEDVLRWVPSGCSDPLYRVLALEYLSRTRQPGSETWDDTTLAEDTTVVGDLVVRGHLTNGAALTVLGDLTIEGAYIADGDYPCCQVAGRLSSKNYFAVEAETIALGGLHVADTFWVSYNHTITIAPVRLTKVLIYLSGPLVHREHDCLVQWINQENNVEPFCRSFGNQWVEECQPRYRSPPSLSDTCFDFQIEGPKQ